MATSSLVTPGARAVKEKAATCRISSGGDNATTTSHSTTTFEERFRMKMSMESESKPRRATDILSHESREIDKYELESRNRRSSMPDTFEERLQQKTNQDERQDKSILDAKCETIEQQDPIKIEPEGGHESCMSRAKQLRNESLGSSFSSEEKKPDDDCIAKSPSSENEGVAKEGDNNANHHNFQRAPTFEERFRRKVSMESESKPRRATDVLSHQSREIDKYELEGRNRRSSMPDTFEERLQQKSSQDRRKDKIILDAKCETNEQQLPPKKESKADNGSYDMSCVYKPKRFKKVDINHTQKVDNSRTVPEEALGFSFCSKEIEPEEKNECHEAEENECREDETSDLEAQFLAQTKVQESEICLDEMLEDLLRLKQENGNLTFPQSHPTLVQFRSALLSNEVEPLVKSVKWHDEALQQKSSNGGGVSAQPEPTRSVSRALSSYFRGSIRASNHNVFIQATLVEDEPPQPVAEVVVAEHVGFFARAGWKIFASALCISLGLMALLVSLFLTKVIHVGGEKNELESLEVFQPTSSPTSSPTFDPRSTLKIVQERGYVKCGLRSAIIDAGKGFQLDLCRSIAAVIFGNPESFEAVPVTYTNRWQRLHSRATDLLLTPDTHTVEREVRESSTGAGFTFSSVYNYDGMVYFGNRTYVHCAEEQKRYDECIDLIICVVDATTHYDFITTAFPLDFFKVGASIEDVVDLLFNDTCKVAGWENSLIYEDVSLTNSINDRGFVIGTQMKTKEPLAVVTRNSDREFSDIVNWVIQALFFGEEHFLEKDMSLCRNYTNISFYDAGADLDFMNAVYCVGNFGQIFDGGPNRGMNQINQGTGMLYAIPFGDIGKADAIVPTSNTMAKIRKAGSLKCGVVDSDILEDSDIFLGNISLSYKLLGMGVHYCRTVAAALLNGDPKDVTFQAYRGSEIASFIALENGEIDLLIGGKIQRKYDFAISRAHGGFYYSFPYYYGNEVAGNDVSFYSITMREDDVQFASFVNSIILATVYAQEKGIRKETSLDMPLITLFGSDLTWSLRDAIFYSGSYDEIYSSNFGGKNDAVTDRGRNTLNSGGSLMLSFPQLP